MKPQPYTVVCARAQAQAQHAWASGLADQPTQKYIYSGLQVGGHATHAPASYS